MLTILTFLALWFAASVVTVAAYSLLRWLCGVSAHDLDARQVECCPRRGSIHHPSCPRSLP